MISFIVEGINDQSIFLLGAVGISSFASATTLEEFLERLKNQNKSNVGADLQTKGAGLQVREADLIFTPKLFLEAQKVHSMFRQNCKFRLHGRQPYFKFT